jgi:murein DD-endopeptidase MepM/ murein hydrolase activator NlpD
MYVTSPAWKGLRWRTAGLYYSWGTYHGSWDISMPVWTPLYAIADGTILDRVTSVPNNTSSTRRYSGMPANYVMLGFVKDGQKHTAFYQHLSPGMAHLGAGTKVKRGQLIGYSGLSGNTSGPHLHLTVMRGWVYGWQRYNYLTNRAIVVYPPSQAWIDPWGSGPVRLSKLKYGTRDSDSVRRLQRVFLKRWPARARLFGLVRVTGNYGRVTDGLVRWHQRRYGDRWGQAVPDPRLRSNVGPKQAARLFGSRYTIT